MATATLITGATDGIGLALARRLAAEGRHLVLVGRRPGAELDDTLFGAGRYCRADLAAPDAPARVLAFLEAAGVEALDLLVHNAAQGWYGAPEAQSPASIRSLLDVNLRAPVALTHALLPRVLAAAGTIAFVSSILADLPAPDAAVYAASKAGLDGFARALRVELRGRGRVVAVHPGGVATGMHAKAGVPAQALVGARFPSAEATAARILACVRRGARGPTLGFGNRLARFAGRHAAGPLDALLRWRRR